MSFDPAKFDKDNQARLATIGGYTVDSADRVEDALLKQRPLPLLCTLYDGGKSEGRLVSSNKGQRIRVRLTVVIVCESWHTNAAGRDGVLDALKKVKNTIVTRGARYGEWQNPQAEGPYIYESDDFMQRSGPRIAQQVEFYTNVYDDFEG